MPYLDSKKLVMILENKNKLLGKLRNDPRHYLELENKLLGKLKNDPRHYLELENKLLVKLRNDPRYYLENKILLFLFLFIICRI